MTKLTYRLTEPVDGFDEDEILELTAQFGDWHPYDVKLKPRGETVRGSVELTWEQLREVTVAPDTSM